MQAITVKYIGPTNHKGARVKATADTGRSVTLPFIEESSYAECALAFAYRHAWISTGDLATFRATFAEGSTPHGKVFVFRKDGYETPEHDPSCDGSCDRMPDGNLACHTPIGDL